jgi:hypothetical protein
LLELIPCAERYEPFSKNDFFDIYPFFRPGWHPKPPVYPAKSLISRGTVHFLKSEAFREEFDNFSSLLSSRLKQNSGGPSGFTFVHRLPLDRDFLDYLRLFAKIEMISLRKRPSA